MYSFVFVQTLTFIIGLTFQYKVCFNEENGKLPEEWASPSNDYVIAFQEPLLQCNVWITNNKDAITLLGKVV